MDYVGRVKEHLDLMDDGPPERWGSPQAFEFLYLTLLQLWVGFELGWDRTTVANRLSSLYALSRGRGDYYSSTLGLPAVARKMKEFRALVQKDIINASA